MKLPLSARTSKIASPAIPAILLALFCECHASVVITEILYDPPTATELGDANGDGTRDAQEDEFIEIVNTSTTLTIDISGWQLGDNEEMFVFPAGTMLAPRQAAVLFGKYDPLESTSSFGGALLFDGDLIGGGGLSNSGEPVRLWDENSNVIDNFTYPSANINQSLTREPDTMGDFVNHSTVAPGVLFSPGTRPDGTSFTVVVPEPSSILLLGLSGIGLLLRRSRH